MATDPGRWLITDLSRLPPMKVQGPQEDKKMGRCRQRGGPVPPLSPFVLGSIVFQSSLIMKAITMEWIINAIHSCCLVTSFYVQDTHVSVARAEEGTSLPVSQPCCCCRFIKTYCKKSGKPQPVGEDWTQSGTSLSLQTDLALGTSPQQPRRRTLGNGESHSALPWDDILSHPGPDRSSPRGHPTHPCHLRET